MRLNAVSLAVARVIVCTALGNTALLGVVFLCILFVTFNCWKCYVWFVIKGIVHGMN